MVIHRNRGLKVVEESGKKDFATECMSGNDKLRRDSELPRE